jgi:hypothetical protein
MTLPCLVDAAKSPYISCMVTIAGGGVCVMSTDLTERSRERPPAAGRSRPVPYLKLVHSADEPSIVNEQERRKKSFSLIIAVAAIAVIGALALWLA